MSNNYEEGTYKGLNVIILEDDYIMSDKCYFNNMDCCNCVDSHDCVFAYLTRSDLDD